MNSKEIARLACEAMEDKKAQDIKIINIEQVSTLADYFILGADSLYDFEKWKEPGRILKACTILVATRNHTSYERLEAVMTLLEEKYGGRIEKLDSLNIDISSKQIRSWIHQGRSLAYYVPETVISYITENKIYKDCDTDEIRNSKI